MNSNALSVVSRLPQHYRLAGNDDGRRLEALPESLQSREDSLTGLKLLSHGHHSTYDALCAIRSHPGGLRLHSLVLTWEGGPCPFVTRDDDSTALWCS
ncbi:hypothetical protein C4513_18245, partial [Morganella morganii]|uniref:hypothetical protein n=1 Tax=Morganella morganii TaxID=582 RepID=UPI001E015B5A|nr:hypothetical protein [Morganella morganii]